MQENEPEIVNELGGQMDMDQEDELEDDGEHEGEEDEIDPRQAQYEIGIDG